MIFILLEGTPLVTLVSRGVCKSPGCFVDIEQRVMSLLGESAAL